MAKRERVKLAVTFSLDELTAMWEFLRSLTDRLECPEDELLRKLKTLVGAEAMRRQWTEEERALLRDHILRFLTDRLESREYEALWNLNTLVGAEAIRHRWTPAEKALFRHHMFREALDAGAGWDNAGKNASASIGTTHPAWGTGETLKAAYKSHNTTLPPTQRRPRTYRRRS